MPASRWRRSRANITSLVLDAFSSDAIPTHLLTREAFALYRSRVEAGGLVVFHVSNRFLDLDPVLNAIGREAGWVAVRSLSVKRPEAPALGPAPSAVSVVAMAADSSALGGLVQSGYWQWIEERGAPWTDDWTPLASALRITRGSLLGR